MIESAFLQEVQETTKETKINDTSEVPVFAKEVKPTTVLNFEEANKPLHLNTLEVSEARADQIAENREKGAMREDQVYNELQEQYPPEQGYTISQEQYLRDDQGNIVKDKETGEARRIDFVVTKDGEVVKSIEVTSETASKDQQLAKEARIRENGGNYIKDKKTGELIEMSSDVQTEVWRRE